MTAVKPDGEKIRRTIAERGLSVTSFASSANISKGTIYSLLSGHFATPRTAKQVTDVLGLAFSDLFMLCELRGDSGVLATGAIPTGEADSPRG